MHPLVRDLYRRFLWVGRDYPGGLAALREKVKAGFRENAAVASEDELMQAVHKGRWWVNELIAVVKLRKYRAMRAAYSAEAHAHADDAPPAPPANSRRPGAPPPPPSDAHQLR